MDIISYFAYHVDALVNELARLRKLSNTNVNKASFLFNIGKYFDRQKKYNKSHYAYRQYLKYCPNGTRVKEAKERLNILSPHANTPPFTVAGNKRIYAEETILFAQGERGEEFYVIQSGSIRLVKIFGDKEVLLLNRGPGDVVGDVAILASEPRTITAITNERTKVFVVTKKSLPRLVETAPHIIKILFDSLSERSWFYYELLANALLTDPLARLYGVLLIRLKNKKILTTQKKNYLCDFGLRELIEFSGVLSKKEVTETTQRFLRSPHISILDGKILIANVMKIEKEYNYFKNIQHRKKTSMCNHSFI
jgi:CRP/FNR family transcriptional regulator